jgi:hypothetical protein
MILWFFGQPCSGKTTLINETIKIINPNRNIRYSILDNDRLRETFKDKDFTRIGRERNIQRAMDIAIYEHSKKRLVLAGFVTPFNFQRVWLQEQVGIENIAFVYLHYSSKYSVRGRESYHTGDFEAPMGLYNYARLDTGLIPKHKCVRYICNHYLNVVNGKLKYGEKVENVQKLEVETILTPQNDISLAPNLDSPDLESWRKWLFGKPK